MAGPIGGTSGYLTINPTQNYVGQAAQGVEESVTRFRAEKLQKERQKIEDERYQQEQRRRDFNDASEFNEKYKFISTGTGLDASNRQSVENAKNTYAEAQDNYQKTGDKKYLAIAGNAMNSVNNVNEMPKALNLKVQELQTNEKAYNPASFNKVKDVLAKMTAGNIMQSNDANGNPRYTLIDKDDNGNVTKVLYKDLNKKQLMDLLTPVDKFNVSGEKGFIDQFQKSVGKEREVKKLVGNKEVTEKYTPGAEEVAKSMAKEAISNRSAMYFALDKLGLDPENPVNYTDPKIQQQASDYFEEVLKSTTPSTKSEEADYKKANYELAVQKERNDQAQRAKDNARKDREEAQKIKEAKAKEAKIGSPKTVAKEGYTDNGVKVKVEDKIIPVADKGSKDETGFKNALKEVIVHKDGTLTYSFEQDNPEDWVLTAEGKSKVAKDPNYKPTTSDYLPQKPRKANYKTSGQGAKANEVETGILTITNPDTGELFTSTVEADEFFRNKAGVKKTTTVSKKVAKPQSKPKQVVQNGITYTLNTATGEYE